MPGECAATDASSDSSNETWQVAKLHLYCSQSWLHTRKPSLSPLYMLSPATTSTAAGSKALSFSLGSLMTTFFCPWHSSQNSCTILGIVGCADTQEEQGDGIEVSAEPAILTIDITIAGFQWGSGYLKDLLPCTDCLSHGGHLHRIRHISECCWNGLSGVATYFGKRPVPGQMIWSQSSWHPEDPPECQAGCL